MGPVVTALRALYFDVVRGKNPEYRHWCHPVYSSLPLANARSRSRAANLLPPFGRETIRGASE